MCLSPLLVGASQYFLFFFFKLPGRRHRQQMSIGGEVYFSHMFTPRYIVAHLRIRQGTSTSLSLTIMFCGVGAHAFCFLEMIQRLVERYALPLGLRVQLSFSVVQMNVVSSRTLIE
jgi:hypothetical protein